MPAVSEQPQESSASYLGLADTSPRQPELAPAREELPEPGQLSFRAGLATCWSWVEGRLPADVAVAITVARLEEPPHALLLSRAGRVAAATTAVAGARCRHRTPALGRNSQTCAAHNR